MTEPFLELHPDPRPSITRPGANPAVRSLGQQHRVSPPRCGQGQPLKGVRGVFLLPVFASTDAPEPKTLECTTTAHKVLVEPADSPSPKTTTARAGPCHRPTEGWSRSAGRIWTRSATTLSPTSFRTTASPPRSSRSTERPNNRWPSRRAGSYPALADAGNAVGRLDRARPPRPARHRLLWLQSTRPPTARATCRDGGLQPHRRNPRDGLHVQDQRHMKGLPRSFFSAYAARG
jgi:hypothetical protein